jgi:alpha-tubulin suppressor-like RCC1 family protein
MGRGVCYGVALVVALLSDGVMGPAHAGQRRAAPLATAPFRVSSQVTATIVHAWGANNRGQLGVGTTDYSNVPIVTHGITDVVAVAAGAGHSLALRADGMVWDWGANGQGQLGIGGHVCQTRYWAGACSLIPVHVPVPGAVIAIAAGGNTSVALARDGTVWAWGANGNFQLGFRTALTAGGVLTPQRTPARVPGLAHIVAIAIGPNSSGGLAIDRSSAVWSWGEVMRENNPNLMPSRVPGVAGMVAVATNGKMSLALKKDGTVWAWGSNDQGMLGTGVRDQGNQFPPRPVRHLTDVVAISVGGMHSLALKRDGTVWVWGNDNNCLLGLGQCSPTHLDRNYYVSESVPTQVPGLRRIVAVVAGENHDLALARDGRVWTWGNNAQGQLGLGISGGLVSAPVLVPRLAGIVALAAGTDHTLAIGVRSPH